MRIASPLSPGHGRLAVSRSPGLPDVVRGIAGTRAHAAGSVTAWACSLRTNPDPRSKRMGLAMKMEE